jgi:REP element-mobilizing transposase RayT
MMTVARVRLVDPQVTRWYHCISRCVRRAFLFDEGAFDRKDWIEHRLRELAETFAVSVAGFAILDNHLHVLVRLDVDAATKWTDEEVARRWGRLYPPRDKSRKALDVSADWLAAKLKDARWIAQTRLRLQNLGWFMKCLKEPLSRLVNREERTRGTFFEGRFKSVAVLDEESLLAVCAYIDLNPVAAGIARVPEQSEHTSVKQRVDHVRGQRRLKDLKEARRGSVAGSLAARGLEESHWLCPIEDRRRLDSSREGMIEDFSLGSYLLLVEYTGRLLRPGKASIPQGVAELFTRLNTDEGTWSLRLRKLSEGRWWGRFFARSREKLRAAASHLGVHRLANLGGCLVT